MSAVWVHRLLDKRTHRLSWINWILMIGSPVSAFIAMAVAESFWYALLLILFPFGLPVKDYGNIFYKWRIQIQSAQIWQHNGGVTEEPSLLRHANAKDKGKRKQPVISWEGITTILMNVSVAGKEVNIPLLFDSSHVTALIKDDGLSEDALSGDAEDRYFDDLTLVRESIGALCKTRHPDVLFGTAYIKTKADPTLGYEYNRRRGNRDINASMGASEPTARFDESDMIIGEHAIETHDTGYHNAGRAYNLSWIRMPFPRNRLGQKVDLTKAHKVRETAFFRTVTDVMRAFKACGIGAELLEEGDLNLLLLSGFNVAELTTIYAQGQRDRELVKRQLVGSRSETASAKPGRWRPRTTSFGYSEEHGLGYMVLDGTFVAAGHVDAVTRKDQAGGYMSSLLTMPSDISFAFVSIIDAPIIGYEKFNAKEKERWTKIAFGLFSVDDGLSKPDRDIKVNQVVEMRRKLHESGDRAGNLTNLALVFSDSVQALRYDWDDVVSHLTGAYQIEQVHLPAQISRWLMGVFGVIPNK